VAHYLSETTLIGQHPPQPLKNALTIEDKEGLVLLYHLPQHSTKHPPQFADDNKLTHKKIFYQFYFYKNRIIYSFLFPHVKTLVP
jgi:hypothetical protein